MNNNEYNKLTSLWPTLMISPKYLIAGLNLSCISQQKNTVLEATRFPSEVIWENKYKNVTTCNFFLSVFKIKNTCPRWTIDEGKGQFTVP